MQPRLPAVADKPPPEAALSAAAHAALMRGSEAAGVTYGALWQDYALRHPSGASLTGAPPPQGAVTVGAILAALVTVGVFIFFAVWTGLTIRNYRANRYRVLERAVEGRDWIVRRTAEYEQRARQRF